MLSCVAVDGQQFVAVDITFENTAGPEEGQWHFDQIPTFQYFIDVGSRVTKIRYIHTIIDNSIENAESVVQWISSLVMQLLSFKNVKFYRNKLYLDNPTPLLLKAARRQIQRQASPSICALYLGIQI